MSEIIKQLEEMNRRFEELDRLMEDPEVISKDPRYPAYVRERGSLVKMVSLYRKYLGAQKKVAEARAIIEEKDQDRELVQMAREELAELRKTSEETWNKMEDMLATTDEDSNRNVIMEIRAGTGGDEAGLFAGNLMRMYLRYAERQNWKTEIISVSRSDLGGVKEVIFRVEGDEVYRRLRFESGTHRVQRVPETEAQGRIHTSACTVAVLPEAEEVEVNINKEDLRIDLFNASGPGGQHVNKTQSAVRITHLPTGLVVSCQDEKSQHRNKTSAMQVLATRLYDLLKHKQESERGQARRAQIGSGDRSERIRTYNFPQNRLTDHRIGLTLYDLNNIIEGKLDEMIRALEESLREKMRTKPPEEVSKQN
jgi:peptide chain release factor 1